MTAQIDDVFRLRRKNFALAGISEGELFAPSVLDLNPVGVCSACWRGYQAEFGLRDSHLILDSLHLTISASEPAQAPLINGVTPTGSKKKYDWFNTHYNGLRYPIEYTGGLLLAAGFIKDLYVHMGFHPPWKYEQVVELIFADGVLIKEYDRSEQMAEFRAQYLEQISLHDATPIPARDEIERFIERAFDRRY